MPFKLGGEIPKGHVKLPEPLTSDYLQAQSAVASSEYIIQTAVDLLTNATASTNSATGTAYISTFSTSSNVIAGLGQDIAAGDYLSLAIGIDTTNAESFTFDYKAYAYVTDYTGIDLELYIDGTQYTGTTFTADGNTYSASVDVSGLSAGTHTFEFRLINNTGNSITNTQGDCLNLTISNGALNIPQRASNVLDEDTTTYWQPSTSNAGEHLYLDLGTPTILGGARIYWLDAVPNAYRLQASLDATNWTDVYAGTSAPNTNDWTEYSWYATYARYLRLYLDDQGTNPVKVAVFDYYSRITDRVAAEHGHGSGVERWKKGRRARRGFHREKKLDQLLSKNKKKNKVTKQDILKMIEELKDYINFKVPD